MFEELEKINTRPEPFEFYTASDLWTDDHTSKQMLSYHLNDEIDRSMLESINSMAHLLEIRTIAENVDDELVVAKLKAVGVDYAQGYFLGDLVQLDEVGSDLGQPIISEPNLN